MRLIESYLDEVSRYLPAKQRGDIVSELRVSLEDQAQDLAGDAEPGPEHEKAAINQMGHPLQVASGYQGQRYLIGPELFPSFIVTLKTVAIIVVLIQFALLLTSYVTVGNTTSLLGLFKGLLEMVLWSTIWVVGVFVAIEFSGERLNWYKDWSADSLKPTAGSPVDNGQLITNLITEGAFLLWWNDVLVLQNWIPGGHEVFSLTLTETWTPLFWPLNVLVAAWFLLHAYVLYRGLWQRGTVIAEVVLGGVFIAIGLWLISHAPLAEVAGSISEFSAAAANRVIVSVIVVIMALTAWDSYTVLRRLRRD
ncbi:MAG: hypothetical protein AAFN78_04720 [Pseudomonadota bacterium]